MEAVAGGTEVGRWRDGGTGRGALNESPVDATFPQPELWRHSHNQQGLKGLQKLQGGGVALVWF